MKWSELIHILTLGKYQTTFFFKNRQFHSSKIAFALTIFFLVAFLIFSINVLRDVFVYKNFKSSVIKVGDKTLEIVNIEKLTLLKYMNESETQFDITAYRNFSYLD